MIRTLQQVLEQTLDRLANQVTTYLPPFLVALVIILGAWVVAFCLRILLNRAFKGSGVDRFLHESGIGPMLDHSGRLRASPIVANTVFWGVMLMGLLNALSVFDTRLTTQFVDGTVSLLPKLLTAGGILLVGFWLAQYLGRSVLVWASNEGFPWARYLAALIRVVIVFVSVVVAADVLQFARTVFLAAFIIFAAAVMLTISLVLALNSRDFLHRLFPSREPSARAERERSLWSHL